MSKRKRRPRRILGPKYAIYSAGKDTHLVVPANSAEEAVKKARRCFPSYMLGYPAPLTARLFRDGKGDPV